MQSRCSSDIHFSQAVVFVDHFPALLPTPMSSWFHDSVKDFHTETFSNFLTQSETLNSDGMLLN